MGIMGCDDDDDDDPAGPDPTATPSQPTPTPTPQQHPGGNCRRGTAVVKVTNIPVMTDDSKETYNKTLLFYLHDDANSNFVGVYHRYVQPGWPDGPWYEAWRFEAGAEGCIEEWHILKAHELTGTEATFEVSWDHNNIQVRHQETGNTQDITVDNISAFSQMSADGHWGWHSPATPELLSFTCSTLGDPTGCY